MQFLPKELSGKEFVEIMEKYGITPSELGITRSYKNKLKNGKSKPSRKLVKRLYELITLKSLEANGFKSNVKEVGDKGLKTAETLSHGAGVAQPVERGAVNPVVGGSNPPPGATIKFIVTM